MQRDVKLFAPACKIFIKLLLGLFKDRGGRRAEFCIHISLHSSQVPFGTRHSLPVTQTQGIVQRSQDEFPARCGVKLCANRLLSKVFCDHLSRQRVEGMFDKLRDKERPKESAYVFNLICRTPLKTNEGWK